MQVDVVELDDRADVVESDFILCDGDHNRV
jgi:hypothetical protein